MSVLFPSHIPLLMCIAVLAGATLLDTSSMESLKQTLIASGANILEIPPDAKARIVAVINAFEDGRDYTLENTEAIRVVSGHINTSYFMLNTDTGEKCILQDLNTIFDIDAIDNNLQRLEEAQEKSRALLPEHWQPVSYLNVAGQGNRKIYYDENGHAWRAMRFVSGRIKVFNSFSEVPVEKRPAIARSLGEAIAVFGKMLDAVPADCWQHPLPNFHNTQYHLQYLNDVLTGETIALSLSRDVSRRVCLLPAVMARHAERVTALLKKIEDRAHLVSCLDHLGRGVAHGDTKINNFIFRLDDDGEFRCACLIDLDTVQLGNLLDDLGDALRSAGNPAGEEPANIADVQIDEEVVGYIIEGYVAKIGEFQGQEQADLLRRYAIDACKQFLYAQCMRFLADALVGNAYFKLKPGLPDDINLYRAEVQMRALEKLEETYG